MNYSDPIADTTDLPLKLMDAIQDSAKWGDALDTMMKVTGAKAAIITLRDKSNCQIVNDVELEQKFHSPLIRGFSTEAIVHYLTNLRTIDPWAEFQRTHYPHRPVQMSKVCPQSAVPDTRFFDWLGGEGLVDSVVFELDRMAGYWTAINLFLEKPTGPTAERTLKFAETNYELLRNAWVASQRVAKAQQVNGALLDRAAKSGAPVCVVSANGSMLECNDLFDAVIETDAIRISGNSRKLSFGRSVTVQGLTRWEQHDFLAHDAETAPLLLSASPIHPDPMFADKREQLWLLTCSNMAGQKTPNAPQMAFDLEALTRQERDLYSEIAAGRSVEQAGTAIQLKRSRTFEVWSSVKHKLGITSAHQLRN